MFYFIDSFDADIAKQKWDRLKIVCRQPFKKEAQFGVSFLRLKSASNNSNDVLSSQAESTMKSIENRFFSKKYEK